MNLLITLVVVLIIVGLAYWAVHKLAAVFGVPAPIVAVIDVALVIIVVIYLLELLLPGRVPAFR